MLATLIIAVRRGRLVTGSLDWPADLGHLQFLQRSDVTELLVRTSTLQVVALRGH